MPRKPNYLDPKTLAKMDRLDLLARFVVEGYLAGTHRSPYRGFAVEFAEHREYSPGDEIKHIDWRVYGRTERYYIKQYQTETNFTCHLLLDASESMRYSHNELTKLHYAKCMAASLAYLILAQQDRVAVGVFDEGLRTYLEPSGRKGHLNRIVERLDVEPGERKTDLGAILNQFADRIEKRGIVILISDLFGRPEQVAQGIQHLRFAGHECIIFQVLDHYEWTFPFEGMWKFLGLEGYPELLARPRDLRVSYLQALADFNRRLQEACNRNRTDLVPIDTDQPLDLVLTSYLVRREKYAGR
jgi:uncharacterized protein (DUF58 family)